MCIKKLGNYNSAAELDKAVKNLVETTKKTRLEISKIVGVSAATVSRIVVQERKIYNRAEAGTRSVELVRKLNMLWPPTEVPVFDVELEEYIYE